MVQESNTPLRARWPLAAILCLLWTGIVFTEQVSMNILSVTVEGIARKPWLVGIILGFNPLFGFIAQPLVGVWSDKIWTPLGRRAFFLITASPIVALCLIFVPLAATVWQIFILVLAYQFFQDILWGSDHPLLADLVPPRQRTLVNGLMIASSQIAAIVILRYFMKWWEGPDAKYIYWIAALLQILLVCIPAFFLHEKPNKPKPRPKLSPKRYAMDVLGDPFLRKFAAAQFLWSMTFHSIATYAILYATKNLAFSQGEFSTRYYCFPLILLIFAIPMGFIGEMVSKGKLLAFGLFMMTVSAVVMLRVKPGAPGGLLAMAACFGAGALIIQVVFKPFMTEFFAPDIIGQLAGAMNIFHALGRWLVILAGGFLVSAFGGNYGVVFYIPIVTGILGMMILFTIRDDRFIQRKRNKAALSMPEAEEIVTAG